MIAPYAVLDLLRTNALLSLHITYQKSELMFAAHQSLGGDGNLDITPASGRLLSCGCPGNIIASCGRTTNHSRRSPSR